MARRLKRSWTVATAGLIAILAVTYAYLFVFGARRQIATYKPDYEVAPNPTDLSQWLTRIPLFGGELLVTWHDGADDGDIGPPYKLRLGFTANENDSTRVFVDSLIIAAGANRNYQVADTIVFPLKLELITYEFEPEFYFDHDGGESITLGIFLHAERPGEYFRHLSLTRWLPYKITTSTARVH